MPHSRTAYPAGPQAAISARFQVTGARGSTRPAAQHLRSKDGLSLYDLHGHPPECRSYHDEVRPFAIAGPPNDIRSHPGDV